MKELLLVFTLGAGPSPARAADPWIARDKIQHFFAAAFVQSIAYGGLRAAGAEHGAALAGATVATAGASLGKEIVDRRKGRGFSARDLVWDAAGAGAATILLVRTVR